MARNKDFTDLDLQKYKRFVPADEAKRKDCKMCVYNRKMCKGVVACNMEVCPAESYDSNVLYNKKNEIKNEAAYKAFVQSIVRE